jgi:FkbH-like protein
LVLARLSGGLNPETLRLLGFRTLKVAVLGDVTTQHLVPLFRAALLYRGIIADVRAGDFGQMEELLLERSSWMHEFAPNLVVLVSSTLAAHDGDQEDFATLVKRRLDFARNVNDLLSADVVLTAWEPLPEHTGPRGLPDWIKESNMELRRSLPAQAFLFDLAALVVEVGVDRWFDLRYWGIARQSFHLEHTPLFAARLAAFVRSLLEPPIKLVVTDLDNTLWGGEVAELGPEGIEVGGNEGGLAYARLQGFLKQCVAEGLVLAACSKNTPEAARRPFLENPEMRLSLSDFAEFRASFMPKTLMIREIAQTLNLGLEQTLFLDDSSHERAEVREHMPEVVVPEWPSDGILGLPTALARSGMLARPRLTEEDRRRAAMYLEEGRRREFQVSAASVEEFLASLGLVARVMSVNSSNLERVTQLVQKTNQFNLTTIRRSRGEIEGLLATPGTYSQVLYLEDRYGPYGLTGLIIAVPRTDCLFIDTWLMSCRIMGKTVEYAMFEHLLEHARANNWALLEAVFRLTERNAMVASLYPEMGFTLLRECPGGVVYRFRTDKEPARTNRFVRIVGGGGQVPESAE